MQNIFALHRRATATVLLVVGAVRPAHLDRPTPCAGWDLRALLEHMTGQDHGFAAAVRATLAGSDVDVAAFAPRPLGQSPATSHAAGAGGVVAAFTEAAGLERPVLLPEFGTRLPLPIVAGMHVVDTVVHGWDVAATLGSQADYGTHLDADVVAAALEMAEQVPDGPAREASGAPFGPVLAEPAEADAWTRTLALLGRDPAWAAPAATSVGLD
jgi:uncharacterized protein (TIGR03086 family)